MSMLDSMPEEARVKVFFYTQNLFTSNNLANPFVPLSEEQVLSDLNISRQQAANGEGLNMKKPYMHNSGSHRQTVSDG